MSVIILIPTALRQLTGDKSEVIVQAKTIGEALDQLTIEHPILKKHLFNKLHHPLIILIWNVKFHHCKFRVMSSVHSFISKVF